MKFCCFFGHRETPNDVKPKLIKAIENLIINEKVNNFYVGNQGGFDGIVYSALKELKQKYPQISYAVVLAYLPADNSIDLYDGNSIYPEGLENVPKRFAISKRNDWLITNSDYCICYITQSFGGAAQFAEKAKRKHKTIINLAYP